jgi:hypothetical protein
MILVCPWAKVVLSVIHSFAASWAWVMKAFIAIPDVMLRRSNCVLKRLRSARGSNEKLCVLQTRTMAACYWTAALGSNRSRLSL